MSFCTRSRTFRHFYQLYSNHIRLSDEGGTMVEASTSTQKHFGGIIPPVNSKCEIRFSLDRADWLSKEIREQFRSKFARFISSDDVVIVHSDKTRYQADNLADCFAKLRRMLEECAQSLRFSSRSPSEEDLKILRERLEANARRRLEAKRWQSDKKKLRSHSDY
ncbi:Peptidyl-tRNA hydrolase ICT1, mitochondrial [Toxocara canis]|uniref:Peptidyl-tRNA hydrolase ICT1, mitochondrial n=2 Tax=Toxocara canis TaxID=6265 RepID=A0A0B2UWN9_TOXCA|nr:Peptidyl-tRNA hydrolase ICT1, mitochondrial [Toxocara canis]VDM42180.1 unnamed protein product [Toxocara canis]